MQTVDSGEREEESEGVSGL